MNITLLGNAIWGDNSSALQLDLDSGAQSRLSVVGCLLEDYGTAVVPTHQTKFLPDVSCPEIIRLFLYVKGCLTLLIFTNFLTLDGWTHGDWTHRGQRR